MTMITAGCQAFADEPFGASLESDPMSAESMIEVLRYDKPSGTFVISNTEEPGAGPLFVTPEDFAKSVRTVKLDRIKRVPSSIVGHQFKTDRPMYYKSSEWVADHERQEDRKEEDRKKKSTPKK